MESLGEAINSAHSEPDVYVDPGDGMSSLVHLREAVNSGAFEYGATVSPDGRWLWFTSHRGGSADVYRIETAAVPALASALVRPARPQQSVRVVE